MSFKQFSHECECGRLTLKSFSGEAIPEKVKYECGKCGKIIYLTYEGKRVTDKVAEGNRIIGKW